ncbi:NAD(P)-dependent dehydrogenase (short-subunit alcohol dehydrogenase family) [Rubricella aquisinus]|uniref:NAD(P)-dependent dehydrogenase (Short-subunit alcohol dehydrogenase family) n=1 Tax=Rubricella aquisinus TaxID=2028108 RepID=A0A840WST4_9RHOB|nr:SDR family oxidoreductase [Rubricella aquisinus]MBB5516732.1 NAD(P)-dependent dehydrogenase (short-subunit alcohol dehydrogenase family) [Rubricella aquisinus]
MSIQGDFDARFRGGRALVIGSTGAIGSALIDRFKRVMAVDALSRRENGFDVTEESSVEAWAKRLPEQYQIIFNATGALEIDNHGPEKTIRAIDPEAMAAQFALNAIGPALILKHLSPLLADGGVFASMSARVGSIGDNGLGGWISYRAAKAAQNQIVHTAAIEIARKKPKAAVVALHPGTVESELTRKYLGRHGSVTPDEAADNLARVIAGLGPEQNGGFFDWKGEVIAW